MVQVNDAGEIAESVFRLNSDDAFRNKLINSGYKALYEVPMYKKYALNRHYPNTEQVTKKIIWMDIHKFKEQNEIDEEIDILHSTVKQFMK